MSTNPFTSQQSGHKYTFQLQLRKLSITPSLPFDIKIIWARGQQRIQNQNQIKLNPPENQVILNQCFCNKSTVLFNKKTLEFRKKQSKIQIILYANNSPKQGGQYILNLCEILDPYNIKKSHEKVYKVVTRQQKPHCQIQFKLTADYFQQMVRDQMKSNQSIGSGIASISSKATTILTSGGIGSNMNQIIQNHTILGSQNKNYIDKKNVFLYQAPSKDNQSVTSYTSYGTGVMRYGSNSNHKNAPSSTLNLNTLTLNKQKQQPSSIQRNLREQEYGLKSRNERQSVDIFQKNSTNIKTSSNGISQVNINLMKQFDSKSRNGSSYNRYTQSNQSGNYNTSSINGQTLNVQNNNFDTRTENFDQSNKQLIDEQSKRSKLQAEVSKLNIYIKEQSSKLTEYITQNTKLKQQFNKLSTNNNSQNDSFQKQNQQLIKDLQSHKLHYEELIEKLKHQNSDLHNRSYELNNENRDLQRRISMIQSDKQRTQQQIRRMRIQKQRNQMRQNNNTNLHQTLAKQMQSLKLEIQNLKIQNYNLKDNLQKQHRRSQQLYYTQQQQLYTISNIHNLQELSKKKQQKIFQLQRQLSFIRQKSSEKQTQISQKKQTIYKLQKLNQQYKIKLAHNQNQKNKLIEQNKYLRQQGQKIRRQFNQNQGKKQYEHQIIIELQNKVKHLDAINYQNQQKIRNIDAQLQQNKKINQQISILNQTIKKQVQDKKLEIYRLQNNLKSLKDFQNKFYALDKILIEKQRQLGNLKQQNIKYNHKINQLQDYSKKLTTQIDQLKHKQLKKISSNIDVNQILRQSVQMQVQLKFKTDQLIKLKNIQEKFQDIKYQLQIQQKNKQQLENQLNKTQKQLKDKNKLYLIEIQKGKILSKQKTELQQRSQNILSQLTHCQQIITNGDKQVKQMSQHIHYLEQQTNSLAQKLQSTQKQLNFKKIQLNQVNQNQYQYTNKIKALQKQIGQKNYNITLLTTNLLNLQKQVQQWQLKLTNKEIQYQQIKRKSEYNENKVRQSEQIKTVANIQLQKALTQKKSIQIKNQMIMQQLYSLKKQFQQEKGRSTSIVSIRASQEQLKIRQLQNQLQKKDKMISKLTKQKLQIQQENINLHVQVMKKLSQMQKNKDTSDKTISSQKNIYNSTPGQ